MSNQFDTTVNKVLSPIVKDNYPSDLINIIIIIFATKIIPPFPDSVTKPLNKTIFRIIAVFIISWVKNRNATRSAVIAVTFIVGINLVSGRGPFDNPAYTEGFGLLGNINDPDIYYMKNRAKHQAEFIERDLERRNPNRVNAVVHENNKRAKEILKGESNSNAIGIGEEGIPFELDGIYY